jgi:ABC-type transporter Mla MlaB component
MITPTEITITCSGATFTYDDACDVALAATGFCRECNLIVDVAGVQDASTAAFARLIGLRRDLRNAGRDLRLRGLSGRAKMVFDVNKIGGLIPLEKNTHMGRRDAAATPIAPEPFDADGLPGTCRV